MSLSDSQRSFRRIVLGKLISDVGTFFDTVALEIFIYKRTGSGMLTGLFLAIRLAGALGAGAIGPRWIQAKDRRMLLLASDAIRAFALLTLVILPEELQLYGAFAVAAVLGFLGTLFDVCLNSSIPVLLGEQERVRANAILGAGHSIAMAVGGLLAGAVLSSFSYSFAFLLDAVTYLISAANLAQLPMVLQTSEGAAPAEGSTRGFAVLRSAPGFLSMAWIRAADALGSAAHNIGLPILAALRSAQKPSLVMGAILASWAGGKLVSLAICSLSQFRDNLLDAWKAKTIFGLSTIAMSLGFIAVFQWQGWGLLCLAAAVAGTADGLSEVSLNTQLQGFSERDRAAAFGATSILQNGGFGLGMLIAAPLFDLYSPAAVVTSFHLLPILFALAFVVSLTAPFSPRRVCD